MLELPSEHEIRLIQNSIRSIAANYDGNAVQLLVDVDDLVRILSNTFPDLRPIQSDFSAAVARFLGAEVRTMDEAFGVQDMWKGTRLTEQQFRNQNSMAIFFEVVALIHPQDKSKAISQEAAFANLAERYPVSEFVIRDIFREVDKGLVSMSEAVAAQRRKSINAVLDEIENKKM